MTSRAPSLTREPTRSRALRLLEFDSTLASGQTIDYSGGGGTLDLTDPLGYGGSHISGFAATDTVDLAGSWSLLKFSENSGGTLGTLTLTDGTNEVALKFAGTFTQSSFTFNQTRQTRSSVIPDAVAEGAALRWTLYSIPNSPAPCLTRETGFRYAIPAPRDRLMAIAGRYLKARRFQISGIR